MSVGEYVQLVIDRPGKKLKNTNDYQKGETEAHKCIR